MSDERNEFSLAEIRKRRGETLPARTAIPVAPTAPVLIQENTPAQTHAPILVRKSILPFDPWRVFSMLKQQWRWLVLSGCGCALLGALFGWFTSTSSINLTLVLRDLNATFTAGQGEAYRPSQLAVQTMVDLMTSPELVRRVAARCNPPMSGTVLRERVSATLTQEKDLVTLTISGKGRRKLVELAELYADEAAKLGREQQVAEVSRMNQFYKDRIAAADREMAQVQAELTRFQKESGTIDPDAEAQVYATKLGEILSKYDTSRLELELISMQVTAMDKELANQSPVAQKLGAAKAKLAELLSKFTQEHPSVVAQYQQIAILEKQLSSTNSFTSAALTEGSVGSALYLRLVELQTRKSTLETELRTLDDLRHTLREKVTGVTAKGLGYAAIKAKLDSQRNSLTVLANRQREAQLYEANAEGYFRLFAAPRIGDVATFPRWGAMFGSMLAGLLSGILGAAFVLGGREIADNRLKTPADVERATGLPVLASLGNLASFSPPQRDQWAFQAWNTISGKLSTSPDCGVVCGFISSEQGEGCSTWMKLLGDAAAQRGLRVVTVNAKRSSSGTEPNSTSSTTPSNVVASPGELIVQSSGNKLPVAAEMPLENWIWNLERRQQWRGAMAQWLATPHAVVLVKLPPASDPEAVLLAENLPQLIWVAESGKAKKTRIKKQLEALRHAKCRLAGAVLNRDPNPSFNL
jgi:capsular polysaccharide biosynthesis protein